MSLFSTTQFGLSNEPNRLRIQLGTGTAVLNLGIQDSRTNEGVKNFLLFFRCLFRAVFSPKLHQKHRPACRKPRFYDTCTMFSEMKFTGRSRFLQRNILWLIAAAGPLSASAADLPDLIVPHGAGVNIHFTRGHEQDLDMIAAAGIKWVRMDFGWGGTERKKHEYNWSAYEELTANLEKRDIRPYYILDYSNPLYEEAVTTKNPITGREQKDVASPQHPESVAAYAKWAAAAAEHFKGRRVIWEIWNEPNITFWKPKPDVQQYSALALAACKAIRAADPKATIVGPATSEVPLKFLEDFFATGALELLDAVSVHPYRSYKRSPETALEDYAKLRALIERYGKTARTKKLPILSGEWGYSSHAKGVSLETQAAYLVRQQLVNVLAGVPISIWYDWKNDGPDPNEGEDNFGTVTHDLQPKPAYTALKTFTRELNGFRVERRLPGSTNDYVLLLHNDRGESKLAVWTTTDPHEISLKMQAGDDLRVGSAAAPIFVSLGNRKLADR